MCDAGYLGVALSRKTFAFSVILPKEAVSIPRRSTYSYGVKRAAESVIRVSGTPFQRVGFRNLVTQGSDRTGQLLGACLRSEVKALFR